MFISLLVLFHYHDSKNQEAQCIFWDLYKVYRLPQNVRSKNENQTNLIPFAEVNGNIFCQGCFQYTKVLGGSLLSAIALTPYLLVFTDHFGAL